MPVTIEDLLGYAHLTEMVERVTTGVPKVLPESFYNNPDNVPGDRFRRLITRGNRKTSKISPYGAPPKLVERVGISGEEAVMVHTHEQISITAELLKVLRPMGGQMEMTDGPVIMFRDMLRYQTQQFGTRFENLRNASAHSVIANGKIWFDIDGNLLPTSASAVTTVDYRIPAGNLGNIGGIISAPWSTAGTDIVNQVSLLKKRALQLTGRRLKYAFYGANVFGYLMNNTGMREYLSRNPQYNNALLSDSTQIPNGLLDLTWVPVMEAFYENDAGTITDQFPVDQVTFTPEPAADWWRLRQGGYPVPKDFRSAATLDTLIESGGFEYVYGQFAHAWMQPGVIQGTMNMGDTFLYDLLKPDAVFIADTTP